MSGVSFVSETEIEDVRKKKQEEWEKVRKESDPIECPEPVHDNKTLYERLQEQKQKKQDEWDEQHQLKNMIRGLDGDETVFLDLVAKQQEEIANRRFDEESQEIREYRDAVSQFQSAIIAEPTTTKPAGSAVSQRKSSQESGAKKSQLQLIAGAIKRKSSSSSQESPEKKSKASNELEKITSETHEERNIRSEKSSASAEEDDLKKRPFANRTDSASKCETKSGINQEKQEKQVIPGLGAYSDSSDSDSSSDES